DVTWRMRCTHPPPGYSREIVIKTDNAVATEIAVARSIVRRSVDNLHQYAVIKIQKLHRVSVRQRPVQRDVEPVTGFVDMNFVEIVCVGGVEKNFVSRAAPN